MVKHSVVLEVFFLPKYQDIVHSDGHLDDILPEAFMDL